MFSKFRSLIFKLDPETAHDLAIKSLKFNFTTNFLICHRLLTPLFVYNITHYTYISQAILITIYEKTSSDLHATLRDLKYYFN